MVTVLASWWAILDSSRTFIHEEEVDSCTTAITGYRFITYAVIVLTIWCKNHIMSYCATKPRIVNCG